MRVYLHNHTSLCKHASGTMEEYIQKAIKEKIDIALVISDRYKLWNLNITKDDNENNIASLMDSLSKIKISYIIKNSQVTYQELLFLYNIQNILKV